MEYRRLGDSGLQVSALGLGGWTTFGGSLTDPEAAGAILAYAYDNGINFFDMADIYASGDAERLMGALLRSFPRHTLVLASKVFWPMSDDVNDRGLSRKHVMESIDRSLQRIGTDYLDLYLCHNYDAVTPLAETVRAMNDLVVQGKALYWGASNWTAAQIQAALDLCERHGFHRPLAEQAEYNLLNREAVEGGLLPFGAANGLGLLASSPLASGLLTGKYDQGIPAGSRLDRLEWLRQDLLHAANMQAVRALRPIAEGLGMTRAQLALAWTLRHQAVSCAITGATQPDQLAETLQAVTLSLDADTLRAIETALAI